MSSHSNSVKCEVMTEISRCGVVVVSDAEGDEYSSNNVPYRIQVTDYVKRVVMEENDSNSRCTTLVRRQLKSELLAVDVGG